MPDASSSFLDQFTWLPDFIYLFLGLALIGVMIYWARRSAAGVAGFVIRVDDEDVDFSGEFPPAMESLVADFLRDDCRIGGKYEVRGRWEEGRLVVVVAGDHARAMEQRIRNFLKLNLKRHSK